MTIALLATIGLIAGIGWAAALHYRRSAVAWKSVAEMQERQTKFFQGLACQRAMDNQRWLIAAGAPRC